MKPINHPPPSPCSLISLQPSSLSSCFMCCSPISTRLNGNHSYFTPVLFLLCQVQMSSVEKGCCESLQRRRFLKKLPPVDLRRCWPGPKTKAFASHIAGYLAGRKGHIAPELLNIYLGRQVRCQGQTASTPTFSKRGHLPPRAIARRTEEKGMQTRRNFLGSLFPHNRPAQLFPSVSALVVVVVVVGGCASCFSSESTVFFKHQSLTTPEIPTSEIVLNLNDCGGVGLMREQRESVGRFISTPA